MKRTLLIILLVSATLLTGCGSNAKKEAINKTYNAILAENYTEAEKWAETAVMEGYNNDKFLKLKKNIEVYNDADEALNTLDYALADKKMDGEELFKGNKMSSALSDMGRKILKFDSIVTLYNNNNAASYATAIDYIKELFADFNLTEQQKEKLTEYKESAQQKCIKSAIEEGNPSIAISYADEFLADTTLSEAQTKILKDLKFDAQVKDIEKNIHDKFYGSSAKKKLQALLDSSDLTAAQRNRLQQISPSDTTTTTVPDTSGTRLSPKAYVGEEAAIKKVKQAHPEAIKPNSNVTVTFDNGYYLVNITTKINSGGEIIEDEAGFVVDALTGDIVNMFG